MGKTRIIIMSKRAQPEEKKSWLSSWQILRSNLVTHNTATTSRTKERPHRVTRMTEWQVERGQFVRVRITVVDNFTKKRGKRFGCGVSLRPIVPRKRRDLGRRCSSRRKFSWDAGGTSKRASVIREQRGTLVHDHESRVEKGRRRLFKLTLSRWSACSCS